MKDIYLFLCNIYDIYAHVHTAQMMPDKAACGDRSKVFLSLLNRPNNTLVWWEENHHHCHQPHFTGKTTKVQRGVKWFSGRCPPPLGLEKWVDLSPDLPALPRDPCITRCCLGYSTDHHWLICSIYIEWALPQPSRGAERNYKEAILIPCSRQPPELGPGWDSPRQHCTSSRR